MKKTVLLSLVMGWSVAVSAQNFTPGNLVVLRAGDGAAPLGTNLGVSLFLDEYTTAGILVTSTPLPTTTIGSNRRIAQNSSDAVEGSISLSELGNCIVVAGYDNTIGASIALNVDGVIAKIDNARSVNTTNWFPRLAATDAFSNGSIRGVVSSDGQQYWISGLGTTQTGAVFYSVDGSNTTTQISNTPVTSTRTARIFDEKLYVSAFNMATRIATVGTGAPPTTGPQTLTTPPGLPAGGFASMEFVLLDASSAVAGYDLLYIASIATNPGIYKFSFNGTTWTARGNLTSSSGGLTARFNCNGDDVDLFITAFNGGTTRSNQTQLYKFTDVAAFNANITSSGSALSTVGTLLATAPTNTAFGGLSFTPTDGMRITGTQNIPAGNYHTIMIENGGVATLTGDITIYDRIVVENGGTLILDTYTISSPAGIGTIFDLKAGGAIKIASPYGINASATGATGGNVQTCFRRYSNLASYEYNGTVPQVTGDGLPLPVQGTIQKLTINNSAGLGTDGVTLSADADIGGELALINGKFTTTFGNLYMNNTTLLTTAFTDISFINGPLHRRGNTNFTFPIGKGVTIHPAGMITTAGNPGDLVSAEYFSVPPACTPVTPTGGIHHVSGLEYWRIGRGSMTTPVSQITLYATTYSQATDRSRLVVAMCENGTGWVNLGNANPVVTGAAGPVTSSSTLTGDIATTLFTLASLDPSPVNPLPVNLLSFDALKLNDTKALLKWELASFCSVATKFEIQKAGENKDFITIGSAHGNETNRFYDYTDNGLKKGIYYYRLKITDENGKITYSRTAAVMNGVSGLLLTSFMPSMIQNTATLTIASSDRQRLDLLIVDMQGRVVQRQNLSILAGNTTIQLATNRLSAGIYQLTGVSTNGKTNTIRFMKH